MEATETKLVLPIVHCNGTPKQMLIDARCEVIDALNVAFKSLCQMSPNGRDYYPVAGLMGLAQEQSERRQRQIQSLIDELSEEVLAIEQM